MLMDKLDADKAYCLDLALRFHECSASSQYASDVVATAKVFEAYLSDAPVPPAPGPRKDSCPECDEDRQAP